MTTTDCATRKTVGHRVEAGDNSSREQRARRETCLPAKMRARADNTPDGITVIMPVIYVLHTHARPPLPTPLRPAKFTPRRDDEHAFKQTRSLWRGVVPTTTWTGLVGSPGSWKLCRESWVDGQ